MTTDEMQMIVNEYCMSRKNCVATTEEPTTCPLKDLPGILNVCPNNLNEEQLKMAIQALQDEVKAEKEMPTDKYKTGFEYLVMLFGIEDVKTFVKVLAVYQELNNSGGAFCEITKNLSSVIGRT